MTLDRLTRIAALLAASPYQPLAELGRGSTAEVFLVRHRLLEREFALKLVHPGHLDTPGALERLRREARVIAHLESPDIVRIVDLAKTLDQRPYLVLELLAGRTIAAELRSRGRVPPAECLPWIAQVLRGLSAAHEKGIIHRDITPGNLFLHQVQGAPPRVKILDFGLARVCTGTSALPPLSITGATSTGAMVGSPAYAAPEAFRGEPLDATADVYGVGLISFELLTGVGPFDLTTDDLPSLQPLAPAAPSGLDAVLRRATHRDRALRYPSASEFARALAPFLPSGTP